jgi:amino acid transporter
MILPKGMLKNFTTISYSIFLFLLLSNYFIVFFKYKKDEQAKKIFGLYRFFIVFTIIYIALLPLGGYRPYRPLILRYDTVLPVTVLSIITICYTSIFILKQLKTEKWKYYLKTVYPSVFFLILLFFVIRNKSYIFNECEKQSLYIISQSEEDVVVLENNCTVVGWNPIYNPQESKNYGELLFLWKITDKPKLYYNLQNNNY